MEKIRQNAAGWLLPFMTSGVLHVAVFCSLYGIVSQPMQTLNLTRGRTSIEVVVEAASMSISTQAVMQLEMTEPEKTQPNTQPTPRAEDSKKRGERTPSFDLNNVEPQELKIELSAPKLERRTFQHYDAELIGQEPTSLPKPRPQLASSTSVPIPIPIIEDAGSANAPIPEASETNAPPRYPTIELKKRLEGTVLLRITIEAKGVVSAVEIEKSSGNDALDRAAMEAVIHWKFRPWNDTLGPLSQTLLAPIVFKIKN